MVRAVRLLALAAALVAFASRPARADDNTLRGMQRVTLDRVEASTSALHGMVRLRLFVSAIDLGTAGSVLPISGKKTWSIKGSGNIKSTPYVAGFYSEAVTETAIMIVLNLSGELGEDLSAIQTAISEELLATLPLNTQVGVIGYADDVVTGKLGTPAQALEHLNKLSVEPAPSESPALMRAMDRALGALKRAKPLIEGASPTTMRKMIIVVSDGRDTDDNRDKVTRVGKQADKAGIRIHSVAYSPNETRRPLLNLGELSKQSQGTFRWVQKKVDEQSLRTPFKRLHDEIHHQYVLTMFVPEAEVPHKLEVATALTDRELVSLDAKVPPPTCGELECTGGRYCAGVACIARGAEEGRGILGWLFLIGGIAIGGLVALVGVGFVVTKVREKKDAAPATDGAGGPNAAAIAAAKAAIAAKQTGATAPPAGVAPAPAPAAAIRGPQLIILSGSQTGQRVPLRHGFQIGKAPGCDLSLAEDGFASGHHAQVLMDAAGRCSLVDQGSTNGTYINGVHVQAQAQTRLDDGMSIRCGSTELRFLQHG